MEFLPALIMGIIGNLHCLGMCGPIALAIPQTSESKVGVLIDDLIYNVGRILTYGVLGLIIGIMGTPIGMTKYQGQISITIGVLILFYLFIPSKFKSKFSSIGINKKISWNFKKYFNILLNMRTRRNLFVLGGMNGLLPCGLVYVALFASAAYFDPFKSMTFMLIFGVGTSPIMFAVFYLRKLVNMKFRNKLKRLIPVGIAIVAVMLIIRGMSLGIPYLSPDIPENNFKGSTECH